MSERVARLTALRDDIVRRLEERGVPVLANAWRFGGQGSSTLYAQYIPFPPRIIYAREFVVERQVNMLLHETAHHVRRHEPYTWATKPHEEILAEGSASIALFQLAGFCGCAMLYSVRYLWFWSNVLHDVEDWGGKSPDTNDDADALAGQVLEFLGFGAEV